MHHTYILFSKSKNKFYIGVTSNLDERIRKHNSNHKGFTGGVGDWELQYHESFHLKTDALEREKMIKSWKSRIKILDLVNNTQLA